MHKDLSDDWRSHVEDVASFLAEDMHEAGQSLALAREAMIAEFDRVAALLDAA